VPLQAEIVKLVGGDGVTLLLVEAVLGRWRRLFSARRAVEFCIAACGGGGGDGGDGGVGIEFGGSYVVEGRDGGREL
jgi:hypothetical protein